MKQTKLLVALFMVFALVAAACGSDDADTGTSGGGDETTTDTEAPDDSDEESPPDTEAMDDEDEEPETTEPPAVDSAAGSGGNLLLLQWQAVSLANPYLSGGSKDVLAASLVLEPLAQIDPSGALVPTLATEIPTVENGGISEDLTTITWTLQDGLVWSDGSPVTSEDVVFSWEYCTDETTGCTSLSTFAGVTAVDAVDDLTVTITFDSPTTYPFLAFVGGQSVIIQKAQFAECIGEAAVSCSDQNFAPIGTGPFMITELRPEDTVLYDFNPNYRDNAEGKPFFGTVEIKGGGDAEASARSVLEIGEADYAWNLQVPPEILGPMESAGKGTVVVGFTSQVEHIHLNQTNPEADGGSDYLDGANPHPILFENPGLQQALSLAIDRAELVAVGYGSNGSPTCNMWNVDGFNSTNNDVCLTQDLDAANQILDDLGYADTDGDGTRETDDGLPLEFTFVTSTNGVRQSNQELIKSYWEQIGVDVTMLAEDAGLFFDGTAETSIWRFPSDMEMFTNLPDSPDPFAYMNSWGSDVIPESANGWSGSNFSRMNSPELDTVLEELSSTLPSDPAYVDLVIKVNDI
ncbi:MAG: peptide ABC transporter substrate-binding protein, partial [Acidimicrobiales bacterium]